MHLTLAFEETEDITVFSAYLMIYIEYHIAKEK
jgi:hypothetical protein